MCTFNRFVSPSLGTKQYGYILNSSLSCMKIHLGSSCTCLVYLGSCTSGILLYYKATKKTSRALILRCFIFVKTPLSSLY